MTGNPIKFLEDEQLYLRPIEKEDLEWFYTKALWDEVGRKLTGTQAFFSRLGVQQWFERIQGDDSRIDLVICLKEGNRMIGDLAMLEIDHLNRKAVVRISIFDQAYWGKGYGTASMALLIEYGFEKLNLNRIGLDVFSFNHRAIHSYKKLGFQEEGRIREDLFYDGEYHDSIWMGLLKREYEEHK